MCGRYVLTDHGQVWKRYGIENEWFDVRIPPQAPRFNIAPQQTILTIRQGEDGVEPELARWGFQPAWMQPGRMPPPINAKTESLAESAMWKGAIRRGRVLIPADGFYEWQARPGSKTKQPILIRLKGGGVFAFAGLAVHDAERQPTAAIVTTTPNALMEPIHNRMPVILAPEDEALWLDPETPLDAALACLHPYPAEGMEAYPVSLAVGNVRNQGPELVEPLTSAE